MLAKAVAYNTFIQIFGKVVGFFISGALLIAIAERLGTYNMGNYVTIVAFVGFFVSLSDLGANLVMVRDISQNEKDRERITGEFLGFRLTFSLLIMLLAPIAAAIVPQYTELIVKGTVIIMVSQFLLLVNQMFISMLQTQMMLDKGVLAELANRVVNLVFVLGAIYLNVTGVAFFYAVLYATLVGSIVNVLITFYYARKLWPIRPKIQFETWRRTLFAIAPIGVFSFLSVIHFKADTIILSLVQTPNEVGIYGYAYKIAEIIFTFPVMFVGVVFPKLSQLLLTDKAKFIRLAQTAFDALIVGTIPFLTIMFIGAHYFTSLLSRANMADAMLAGRTLQLLVLAMVCWFVGTLFTHILIMANDYKVLIRNLSIAVVINIVLNLILIPQYSYYGAAIVTGITELIILGLSVSHTRTRLGFVPKMSFLWPTLLSTLGMVVVLLGVLQLPFASLDQFASANRFAQMGILLFFGGASGVVYLGILWLLAGKTLVNHFRGIQKADA